MDNRMISQFWIEVANGLVPPPAPAPNKLAWRESFLVELQERHISQPLLKLLACRLRRCAAR